MCMRVCLLRDVKRADLWGGFREDGRHGMMIVEMWEERCACWISTTAAEVEQRARD